MMKSDEVEAMLHLHALGWGLKRIAREFGCSKNTLRRYVAAEGWMAYRRRAGGGKLEDQERWLQERFLRHRGNAEVVRQDLLRERSIDVSLRTVERAVAPFRRLLTAEARATVRFETPPGRQLQIDFGQVRVPISDERLRVYLFVATLGYSRRCHVAAFRHKRQSSWFRGLEGAFLHFGGVTKEVLIDNPRPLVLDHNAATREVEFNERFLAFAAYWGFRPRACAPYRARTNLPCRLIEADEIWTFVEQKQERLIGLASTNPEIGNQYMFVAFHPRSKLVAAHVVGKREQGTAVDFLAQLHRRLATPQIQLMTDGWDRAPAGRLRSCSMHRRCRSTRMRSGRTSGATASTETTTKHVSMSTTALRSWASPAP